MRFAHGLVAVTTLGDIRKEASIYVNDPDAEYIRTLILGFEHLALHVGFQIAGKEVFRSPHDTSGGAQRLLTPLSEERPYTLQPAIGLAVGAAISVRYAREKAIARFSVTEVDRGTGKRIVFEPSDDAGAVLVGLERLDPEWRRQGRYEGSRGWWVAERFGTVPVVDLERCWRCYGQHVREAALEVLPELVDHVEYGRWFREGEAAIDAGWAPGQP